MTADKSKIYYICIPSCKSITHCEDAERAESLQMIQITWVGIPSPRSAALYQFIISCQYCIDKCNICCVANWMDWNTSSRSDTLCLLISSGYHFYFASRHTSSPRPSPLFCFARQHMSSPRPSPCLRLARRPVFASPVAPSSPRGRPVFASPVASWSPRLRLARRLVVAPSSPRPSPRGRPVFASPVASWSPRLRLARRLVVAPSSPRPSPRGLRLARRLVVAPSSSRLCGIVLFCSV
ncbi:hypothetical protein OUZ56_025129 [Daphnia magna]|uniref:Uncharacterized protein n=1 Tax=Daphnia magna TaxID=35525 RepID=A0ABQ9ZKB9_9CRUS|nr:hypothetical protein OUZ56_025129 [Daphnia magna]